jgi:hypothetical protein
MTVTDSAKAVAQPLEAAGRQAAPWVAKLARIGHVASALVYATIGTLAGRAALGDGGRTTDVHGALRAVLQAPLGQVLLGICAVGFAGNALWRLVDAATDAERHGPGLKGAVGRVRSIGVGIAQGALALAAFRLATGGHDSGGNGSSRIAAGLLDLPGGQWLTLAVGLGVVGYGLYQIYRGVIAKLDRRLDLAALQQGTRLWGVPVTGDGIAARGVVAGLVGVLLVRAGLHHNAGEAGGIRESLQMVARTGRWPLAVVAVGLIAFAVYQLVRARYRRRA